MPDDPLTQPVIIRVKRNGPYLIEGSDVARLRIVGTGGQPLTPAPGRIALCRCGGSSTKPFCDGTHKRKGFTDPTDPMGGSPAAGTSS